MHSCTLKSCPGHLLQRFVDRYLCKGLMYYLLLEAKTKSTSVQEVGEGFSGSVNGCPVRQALNLQTQRVTDTLHGSSFLLQFTIQRHMLPSLYLTGCRSDLEKRAMTASEDGAIQPSVQCLSTAQCIYFFSV